MRHIFVSYSRADSETVDSIVARLTADDLEVWLDRKDIRGGDLWREEIVEAIDQAYAFVLMLSPSSTASDNVRKEVDLAEAAGKGLVPTLLVPVNVPNKLRYQLVGVQWIEYYRDPETKYGELLGVLRARRPKQPAAESQLRREVEIRIKGIDPSKFGPDEQAKLLRTIAEITGTPASDLQLTALRAGSVHAFVDMPARAAYRLKTAALNRDVRLLNSGIDALRLTGDRYFVFLKTGRLAPLKSGGRGLGSGLRLLLALLLSAVIFAVGRSLPHSFLSSLLATDTPTATNTLTPTASSTWTATATLTSTPSQTLTPTSTSTRTPSPTPSYTPTATPIPPTDTFTPTPNPATTFSSPGVTPTMFYGQYCPAEWDKEVTIIAGANDPSGISRVQIFFWLRNKRDNSLSPVNSLPMVQSVIPIRGGSIRLWARRITLSDLRGPWSTGDYWLQFYFVVTDSTGAQAQSEIYPYRATFRECLEPIP